MIETKVDGRPLGDYIVGDLKKHHVEAFVDANRVERIETITDARGHLQGEPRRRGVDEPVPLSAQSVLQPGALEREYLTANPAQRVRKHREFERERRLEPGEEERLRALTKDDWLGGLKPSKLALHTTTPRIDAQRRASGEAAKWEQEVADLQKNLTRAPQKGPHADKIRRSREAGTTVTPPRINRLGA